MDEIAPRRTWLQLAFEHGLSAGAALLGIALLLASARHVFVRATGTQVAIAVPTVVPAVSTLPSQAHATPLGGVAAAGRGSAGRTAAAPGKTRRRDHPSSANHVANSADVARVAHVAQKPDVANVARVEHVASVANVDRAKDLQRERPTRVPHVAPFVAARTGIATPVRRAPPPMAQRFAVAAPLVTRPESSRTAAAGDLRRSRVAIAAPDSRVAGTIGRGRRSVAALAAFRPRPVVAPPVAVPVWRIRPRSIASLGKHHARRRRHFPGLPEAPANYNPRPAIATMPVAAPVVVFAPDALPTPFTGRRHRR